MLRSRRQGAGRRAEALGGASGDTASACPRCSRTLGSPWTVSKQLYARCVPCPASGRRVRTVGGYRGWVYRVGTGWGTGRVVYRVLPSCRVCVHRATPGPCWAFRTPRLLALTYWPSGTRTGPQVPVLASGTRTGLRYPSQGLKGEIPS